MRYKQLLSEKQLDELRMNPRSLQKFADSPEAEGIRAGFEAELIFTGLGGVSDDYEAEPDYDYDERPGSIQGVIDFFSNDDQGYGLHPRGATQLQDRLDEAYFEWMDEQMYREFRDDADELVREYFLDHEWDWEDAIREELDNRGYSDEEVDRIMEMHSLSATERQARSKEANDFAADYEAYQEAVQDANDTFDSRVEQEINDQGGIYDQVLDDYRSNYQPADDRGFWTDNGWRWMSDIANEFDLTWPYWTEGGDSADGEFDYGNAQMLADSLSRALGVPAKAAGGYHGTRRDDKTWIFEPDGSLDPDDPENMPVEIVSPPMLLNDCLKAMENFFSWAEDNGAYANNSTGFHMGVSLPYAGGKVDFVKLALFLGDEHVLKSFGREANTYCKAAMKVIREKVGASHNKEQIAGAMDLMRNNLIELATKQLKIVGQGGFGKFHSINPHVNEATADNNGYIEFRSAGGSNYFEDIDKLKNTLMRYAQAMHVASRSDLERNEYYKKLYKLIAPKGSTSLDLFAKFATGGISKEKLKKEWAEAALAKDAPETLKKGRWKAYNSEGQPINGGEFSGYTEDEAWEKLADKLGLSVSNTKNVFNLVDMDKPSEWHLVDDENQEILDTVQALTRSAATQKFASTWGDDPRWTGNTVDVVRAPDLDEPEDEKPELSPRAKLAKRIKQGPQGQKRTPHGVPEWELYDVSTNHAIHSVVAHDRDDAWQQADDWLRSVGAEDRSTYKERFKIRPMMVSADSKPQVRDIPMDVAQNVQGVEQVRLANGVPIWEIYNSNNDSVVWEIADHTRTAATEQAVSWLRNQAHVRDLSGYIVRPKMLQPGERNNPPAQQTATPRAERRSDFEIFDSANNNVVHTMRNATVDEVNRVIDSYETPSGGYARGMLRVRPAEPQINESLLKSWDEIVNEMALPANRKLVK